MLFVTLPATPTARSVAHVLCACAAPFQTLFTYQLEQCAARAQSFAAFRWAGTGGPVLSEPDPSIPRAALQAPLVGILHQERAVDAGDREPRSTHRRRPALQAR